MIGLFRRTLPTPVSSVLGGRRVGGPGDDSASVLVGFVTVVVVSLSSILLGLVTGRSCLGPPSPHPVPRVVHCTFRTAVGTANVQYVRGLRRNERAGTRSVYIVQTSCVALAGEEVPRGQDDYQESGGGGKVNERCQNLVTIGCLDRRHYFCEIPDAAGSVYGGQCTRYS